MTLPLARRMLMVVSGDVTIDCVKLRLCQVGTTGSACNTPGGCVLSGEKHRVQWAHTGCVDASHHIAIHRKIGAGSFIEVSGFGDVSCDNANPDVGCCECFSGCCTEDGEVLFNFFVSTDGGCTRVYTYRVRAENDGTDLLLSSLDTGSATGCDDACFE